MLIDRGYSFGEFVLKCFIYSWYYFIRFWCTFRKGDVWNDGDVLDDDGAHLNVVNVLSFDSVEHDNSMLC